MFDHLNELIPVVPAGTPDEVVKYTLELRNLSLEQLNAIRKLAQMCGISTSNRAHLTQPADAEGER